MALACWTSNRYLKAIRPTAPACSRPQVWLPACWDQWKACKLLSLGYPLPATRGRAAASGLDPFAASPLRHLVFAVRETAAADNSPEPGRQSLRDTFGQGYWGKREGFVNLPEWLAALGNAEGMQEWAADSEATRMLAGSLRNDHA